MIPCENCGEVEICKSESCSYEIRDYYINPKTFRKCKLIKKDLQNSDIRVGFYMNKIRRFLRPDLGNLQWNSLV